MVAVEFHIIYTDSLPSRRKADLTTPEGLPVPLEILLMQKMERGGRSIKEQQSGLVPLLGVQG